MTIPWRLIKHPPAQGAWNMAVDEAILEAVGAGDSPPTLRLYAWDPPCLSLGVAQPFTDVNISALRVRGWEVVRRPTGGRAILHTDELTYALIAAQDNPLTCGSILESYRRISLALLQGIIRLGLDARADREYEQNDGSSPKPVCFESPSNYEITVCGKKLVGSAQARRYGGVLQHGSLPLTGDLTRILLTLNDVADPAGEDAVRLLERAATVEQLRGSLPTWEEAAAAWQAGFEQVHDICFTPGQLTPAEQARTRQLFSEKYNHPSWTERL